MQVVVTAAGLGKRSGLDGRMRKEMLPIYDCKDGNIVLRPLLEVIISRYRNLGLKDFVLVLSPSDVMTQSYVRDYLDFVTVTFQESAKGFGDAVYCARDYISGDFILNCGDGIYCEEAFQKKLIGHRTSGSGHAVLALMGVSNPKRYGVASIREKDGRVVVEDVEEKPEKPKSNLAIMAMYRLPEEIFPVLERSRERKELTPAIQSLIMKGMDVEAIIGESEKWLSVGIASEYVSVLQRSLLFLSPCDS